MWVDCLMHLWKMAYFYHCIFLKKRRREFIHSHMVKFNMLPMSISNLCQTMRWFFIYLSCQHCLVTLNLDRFRTRDGIKTAERHKMSTKKQSRPGTGRRDSLQRLKQRHNNDVRIQCTEEGANRFHRIPRTLDTAGIKHIHVNLWAVVHNGNIEISFFHCWIHSQPYTCVFIYYHPCLFN